MNYKNIVIVTAKTNLNLEAFNNEQNYIIGVERGCLDLINRNIKIDYAIGDFDKVTEQELELIKSKVKNIEIWSSEKDYFDGELAILQGRKVSKDAQIIFIANATKRYDKNYSIFHFIFKYNLKFINDDSILFLFDKGTNVLKFDDYQDYTYVSFISKDNTNITIKGLKYECENLSLSSYSNSCLSNAFIPYQNGIITSNNPIICILTK
ncbi:thiamine diphosphokinase [Mycoplasma feriruminatoris]|uniref:Thiamine diphosphokinase n=1 Tax=Mycoplasma feriruminatoris TaxID=1179777 RepID=A0AAQ3DNL7_9MOLU|nr:thiamine diphosphokinase [Mycoplasma feriruminatoris]WFQ95333.1 thiamine diphosphokinase [Mycoplasma feriruminatoris]